MEKDHILSKIIRFFLYLHFVYDTAVSFSRVSHEGFYVNYCDVTPCCPGPSGISVCRGPTPLTTRTGLNTTGLSISHITNTPTRSTAQCSPPPKGKHRIANNYSILTLLFNDSGQRCHFFQIKVAALTKIQLDK